MLATKRTPPQPAMTEIKQSIVKRVSLKVSPKLPKLSRSTSSTSSVTISSHHSTKKSSNLPSSASSVYSSDDPFSIPGEAALTAVQEKSSSKENLTEVNNQLGHLEISDNHDGSTADENDNQGAPVLMRNIAKAMPSSTTKTQKTNVIAAAAKSLPKNFIRSLRGDTPKKEKNKPPGDTLITTASLSPPVVSQFSYTSSTIVSERKKKNRRSRSGSISTTAQALSSMLKRRPKNRSGSNDSVLKTYDGAPALTYESFPDPDPDDFFNVYLWDIPDSIVSIEDAGGVLQMVEYDGIFINGVKVD